MMEVEKHPIRDWLRAWADCHVELMKATSGEQLLAIGFPKPSRELASFTFTFAEAQALDDAELRLGLRFSELEAELIERRLSGFQASWSARHSRALQRYADELASDVIASLAHDPEPERRAKRTVRKAGGAIAEAWAMSERMQDVLGQAHREAEDMDARRALSEAGTHYRRMRDEVVRALGTW